jgi:CheY-like chemotaxis protein
MALQRKQILIADDDPEDLELMVEVVLQLEPETKVHTVTNGSKVLDYLASKADDELPCLIILDYNMPYMTGPEVMQVIRKQPRYEKIPRVIWSTSNAKEFIRECMEKGATTYYVKPSSHRQFKEQVREMLGICKNTKL